MWTVADDIAEYERMYPIDPARLAEAASPDLSVRPRSAAELKAERDRAAGSLGVFENWHPAAGDPAGDWTECASDDELWDAADADPAAAAAIADLF